MAISLNDLNLLDKEGLEKLSGVKVIQAAFENGPHGRKVEMAEFKEFDQPTREAFVDEIRPVLLDVAKV